MEKNYEQYYRDDYKTSHHHLTDEGYEKANALVQAIRQAPPATRDIHVKELIAFGIPFTEQTAENEMARAKLQIEEAGGSLGRAEKSHFKLQMQIKALEFWESTIHSQIENSNPREWSNYSQPFQSKLKMFRKREVDKVLDRGEHLSSHSSAHKKVISETRASLSESELRDAIGTVLKSLSYREREIIKLRYGLHNGAGYLVGLDVTPERMEQIKAGDGCSLEEVGKVFKVSRERVRQIEAKAIRKLQKPHQAMHFAGFFD